MQLTSEDKEKIKLLTLLGREKNRNICMMLSSKERKLLRQIKKEYKQLLHIWQKIK